MRQISGVFWRVSFLKFEVLVVPLKALANQAIVFKLTGLAKISLAPASWPALFGRVVLLGVDSTRSSTLKKLTTSSNILEVVLENIILKIVKTF